jgi:hypothetical protein
MPWQVAFLGEVPNLPIVVARVPHLCDLLWWPSCSLLLWRSAAVLLLLRLKLLAIALELQRLALLSRGWRVNHAVLLWSTARITSGGSWHSTLPLLFLSRLTSLQGALLINGGAGEVIV